MRPAFLLFVLLSCSLVTACDRPHAGSGVPAAARPAAKPLAQGIYGSAIVKVPPAELAALGKLMFHDPSLSASGRQSCATCHAPDHAYAPPNRLAVQLGGRDLRATGTRAVPSLRYVQNVPPFTEHFYDNDGDDSKDQGPTGGHDWDGRANSSHEQANGPLLSADEMGNANAAAVVERLRTAAYAERFRKAFGADIFARPADAFAAASMTLEVFQETPAEFYPYTSKYDAVLRGQAQLDPQEARGLALFNRADKGNCATCHISEVKSGAFPAFTDFGFIALGAPRNRTLPANASADFYDLGLCGPLRTDLAGRPAFCGLFRTPSLRNVATRQAFFHNGVFHSLEEVLDFYATRDTDQARWYGRNPDGSARRFDDLPAHYRGNVNVEAPFGGKPGGKPALNKREIADVIAFLKTLTDGYEVSGKVEKVAGR
jgi:cytochrome c peroxidase